MCVYVRVCAHVCSHVCGICAQVCRGVPVCRQAKSIPQSLVTGSLTGHGDSHLRKTGSQQTSCLHLTALGLQTHVWPCLVFYTVAGDGTQVLLFAQQRFLPTEPSSWPLASVLMGMRMGSDTGSDFSTSAAVPKISQSLCQMFYLANL